MRQVVYSTHTHGCGHCDIQAQGNLTLIVFVKVDKNVTRQETKEQQ